MNEKDYKNLIKEYEKLHDDRSDIYILSFEEHVSHLMQAFENENFIKAPQNKQIEVAILWLRDGDALMKYYQAFLNRNIEFLNDALYETAHIIHMSNITSPRCDHGFYGMRITPNLLAANMMDRIKYLLPVENGISKETYVGASIANLLMAIMYDITELSKAAKESAQKQLAKKNPLYCQLHIECMLAILDCDYKSFNLKINDYCNAYMKAREFGMNAFNKGFCVEAHGMYNLARFAFDGKMKDEIVMPSAFNFCQDLAELQNEKNNRPGEIVHVYPEKLDFYNRLMVAKPVLMYLRKEGKKRFIDTRRYLEDIMLENNMYI